MTQNETKKNGAKKEFKQILKPFSSARITDNYITEYTVFTGCELKKDGTEYPPRVSIRKDLTNRNTNSVTTIYMEIPVNIFDALDESFKAIRDFEKSGDSSNEF